MIKNLQILILILCISLACRAQNTIDFGPLKKYSAVSIGTLTDNNQFPFKGSVFTNNLQGNYQSVDTIEVQNTNFDISSYLTNKINELNNLQE